MQNFVVTGGCGYIGSHLVAGILERFCGSQIWVLDDLSNSSDDILRRLSCVNGRVKFIKADIRNCSAYARDLEKVHRFTLIHCAALKRPNESFLKEEEYLSVNAGGTAALLKACENLCIEGIIYSGTASVYGSTIRSPVSELMEPNPGSPYAFSKLAAEDMIFDFANRKAIGAMSLRYFNPIGFAAPIFWPRHLDALDENLFGRIIYSLVSNEPLKIFGRDFSTSDGSCIRDFIDITDLVSSHMIACQAVTRSAERSVFNVGRGGGVSVLELVDIAERTMDLAITKTFLDKRRGEIPCSYADASKIRARLGWVSEVNLERSFAEIPRLVRKLKGKDGDE